MLRTFLLSVGLAIGLSAPLAAAELDDNGLHIADWIEETFLVLPEDLAEANAAGKRLVIMVEQRGCIYCTEMHEKVYSKPEVQDFIHENLYVVRLNLYGALEVTDFDGEVLSERQMARKWGVLFTPTVLFMGEEVAADASAARSAVAMMPGAFGEGTTMDMFTWVVEKRYLLDDGEDFQRYHARRIQERNDGSTD
jgi:thioredoxin-related protein